MSSGVGVLDLEGIYSGFLFVSLLGFSPQGKKKKKQ